MNTGQDIYKIDANDLAQYIKRKQKLLHLKKPNNLQDYSTIGKQIFLVPIKLQYLY